jgi:hypothetical protein
MSQTGFRSALFLRRAAIVLRGLPLALRLIDPWA